MHHRLFWKLFLLQVAAAAALLGGALAVTRTLSIRSFSDYLLAREREQIEQLAEDIAQRYVEHGDLLAATEGLPRLEPRRRHRLLREPGPPRARQELEADAAAAFDPGEPPPPAHPPPRGMAPMPPLQLQDAQGGYLKGDPRPMVGAGVFRQPIQVQGKPVGYLVWRRFQSPPAQAAFSARQARGFALVGLVALALAAVVAAGITALIARPIRSLSAATAALGRREFSVRVDDQRHDELGQLAADFNRLAQTLAGYDTRQRQWLADIAHELRTPVTVLRGELEAVLEGVRPASTDALRSLHEEVLRLSRLIEDLHLLSLAESQGLRLQLEALDAGEQVRASAARFTERFRAQGFELHVDIEPQALPIYADAQRLEQVLANLLENALRHARAPGPVVIQASARGDRIRLMVADAGPGVPATELPRLFDRLYRVDDSRSRAQGGAGLGLSICKLLVTAQRGSIGAQASAAGGLEIEILLPRRSP